MVTMTTVGYGDDIPVTMVGKIIASLCMLTGILFLAFPIILVGAEFEKYPPALTVSLALSLTFGPTPLTILWDALALLP